MLKLDTRDLVDLNSAEADRISAETGNRLRFEVRQMSALGRDGKISQVRARTAMIVNDRILKVDTTIETEIGSMTLMEFWKSDHQKLRCQGVARQTSGNPVLGTASWGCTMILRRFFLIMGFASNTCCRTKS